MRQRLFLGKFCGIYLQCHNVSNAIDWYAITLVKFFLSRPAVAEGRGGTFPAL